MHNGARYLVIAAQNSTVVEWLHGTCVATMEHVFKFTCLGGADVNAVLQNMSAYSHRVRWQGVTLLSR